MGELSTLVCESSLVSLAKRLNTFCERSELVCESSWNYFYFFGNLANRPVFKGVNCTFHLHKRLVFHGTSHIDSIIIMPYQEWYIGLHIARYYYYSHLIYIYKTKKALYKCNICLYMQRVCLHGSHQVHSRFRYIERCFQVSMDLSERHN